MFSSVASRSVLVIALASASSLAQAQDGAQPAPGGAADEAVKAASAQNSDEIVVTAQRREQRLQDVPVSVSVVSGAALEKAGIRNLQEVATRMPAVRIVEGPAADLLNIRGIGSGQNSGFEQSVATFVDGVYRGRGRAVRSALFDLDRVEVLKGPQTTFFGNNAIAGAFNITTRKPGNELAYNFSAMSTPRLGEVNLDGGVSTPLTDTLAIRVAGRYNHQDGYVYNSFLGRKEARTNDKQGRVALRWEPSDNFRSDFRFDIADSDSRGAFPFEVGNCPAGAGFGAPSGFCAAYLGTGGAGDGKLDNRASLPDSAFSYNFKEAAWTNSLQLGGVTLTSISSYFQHKSDQLVQLLPLPILFSNGAGLFPQSQQENYRQFTQELRLQSDTGGVFEYMVGAYYSNGRLRAPQQLAFNFIPFGTIPFLAPIYTPGSSVGGNVHFRQKDETRSVFASGTVRPVEGMRVNLGLRYSEVRKTAHRLLELGTFGADLDPDGFAAFAAGNQALYNLVFGASLGDFANNKRKDTKVQPSIGVQYDMNRDVMAYASYTKGFKAGGFAATSQGETFDPESVNSYEIGIKSSLFNRAVTLNLAAFRMDYSDLQESSFIFLPSGAVTSVIGNAATARSQGIELGANWRVSRAFSINADVSYLDASYRSYPAGACTMAQQATTPSGQNCIQDLSGKARPFAPDWSGNVGANLNIGLDGDNELRINPSVYFSSGFFQTASADPVLRQDAFAKVDLRAAVGPADQRWEFAIIGKNLTDRTTASFRNALSSAPGSYFGLTERPRTVSFQFTIKG